MSKILPRGCLRFSYDFLCLISCLEVFLPSFCCFPTYPGPVSSFLLSNNSADFVIPKSVTCDRFFLPTLPIQSGPTVNMIQNVTINLVEKDLVDLHSMLSNDSHWAKLPSIPSHIKAIIDFITSTKKTTLAHHYTQWLESPIRYFMIFMGAMMLVLTIALIFDIRKKKVKNTNFTTTIPSMKSLQG